MSIETTTLPGFPNIVIPSDLINDTHHVTARLIERFLVENLKAIYDHPVARRRVEISGVGMDADGNVSMEHGSLMMGNPMTFVPGILDPIYFEIGFTCTNEEMKHQHCVIESCRLMVAYENNATLETDFRRYNWMSLSAWNRFLDTINAELAIPVANVVAFRTDEADTYLDVSKTYSGSHDHAVH